MRDYIVGVGLLIVAAVSWVLVVSTDAHANENNLVMKYCLESTGYTPDKLSTFNFSEASRCYHGWKMLTQKDNEQERQEFLKNNPWYRGSNWKWEETAQYKCETIYSTKQLHNVTVCAKPIYIN